MAYLESIDPAALDGGEARTVELNLGPERKVSFHVATAHDILRSQGVKIGKMDNLGAAGRSVSDGTDPTPPSPCATR